MSMACKELVELVTEYLEGTLPLEQRTRFEEHLAVCGGCRTYLVQMRETIHLTGTLSEDDLSQQAQDELLHAFRDWKDNPTKD